MTIEVDDARIQVKMVRMSRSLKDLKPAMRSIGQDIVENIRLGFRDSTDPWGARWKPLAQKTIENRRNKSDKPLVDTGVMRNSINPRAAKKSVRIGLKDSQSHKGFTHQFGGKYKGRRVPPRPFLPIRGRRADLPDDWIEDVLTALGKHIDPTN
jgi:phage gpG-like protein